MNDNIAVPPDFVINTLMDMLAAKDRELALLRISLAFLAGQQHAEPVSVNGDR